jgi:long-chain acyl-CoA synthetase
MNAIFSAVLRHAVDSPAKPALVDRGGSLTYRRLAQEVTRLALRLRTIQPRALGILADNGAAWVLADLAANVAGIAVIPIPQFFSSAQVDHLVRTAAIDYVLTDRPESLAGHDTVSTSAFAYGLRLVRLACPSVANRLPAGTTKVSFTSGTTGAPKGVCLGCRQIETVASSLREASGALPSDRHLCLLPLATLLENIAGVYTPLLAGATICLPPLEEVGLMGSSGLDVVRMIQALDSWQASSAIMVPQMLEMAVAAGRAGVRMPARLRFLAVGGATVSPHLLGLAAELGLPVHQGYGLSECASVVAVNGAGANRPGSVGKLLPHVEIAFGPDQEILVRNASWKGYLGDAGGQLTDGYLATGDLGWLDADGYLYLRGRKKNMFVTSFGRNVSPEWVEGELTAEPIILQAAVFGEARPSGCAVVFAQPTTGAADIDDAVAAANRRLPDYARVGKWIRTPAPFSVDNGLATANGRLHRTAIHKTYAEELGPTTLSLSPT